MVEKHINRIRKEDELKKQSQISSDDEWSHITGSGTKIEAADPLAVTDRTIIFGKEKSAATKAEVVKEKSEEFMDQMNNTNQYLKFVNAHLQEKKNKIEKMKEAERKFKEEIESLQNNVSVKPRGDLDKINSKYITDNDKKSILVHLEREKERLKEKMSHHIQQIETAKQEIDQKEAQILEIKKEIQSPVQKREWDVDPIKIIESELARLGINDESKIIDAINQLAKKARRSE